MPRLLRTASFRLAALYVLLFAASALVLGLAVFLAARSALQQPSAARIEAETAFLREEHAAGGLDRLLAMVRSRGRGATALDYLVQDGDGSHLAGRVPARAGLQPGWTTFEVREEEDAGQPEQVRALMSRLGGGLLLVKGAVPGSKGSYVLVRDAVKRARHADAPFPAGVAGA